MAVKRPGVAYHLTAIAPVRPGLRRALAGRLNELRTERPSPFERLPGTHFVRVAPFDRLGVTRQGEQAERLPAGYLLTSLIFDGDPDRYLVALALRCREQVAGIWGCCEGCPPAGDGIAFAAWLRSCELDALHCFATVPDASAPRIRTALDMRRRLIRFAVATQDHSPGELQAAFHQEFGNP